LPAHCCIERATQNLQNANLMVNVILPANSIWRECYLAHLQKSAAQDVPTIAPPPNGRQPFTTVLAASSISHSQQGEQCKVGQLWSYPSWCMYAELRIGLTGIGLLLPALVAILTFCPPHV